MSESAVGMEALKNAPFFAGLAPADLDGILAVGQPVSFEPGTGHRGAGGCR